MNLGQHTVMVFGAGATKAFLPDAPLVEDDYGSNWLAEQFKPFMYAAEILERERNKRADGFINLETLMTRLLGQMPYDSAEAIVQQSHLFTALKSRFIDRITQAKGKQPYKEDINKLARLCVKNNITCITFNYDDVFDEALWNVERRDREGQFVKEAIKHWHPDGGYGFFVRPSEITINNSNRYMDKTSTLLLKLHGSINWFPKKGESSPYAIDAMYHHQTWYPPKYTTMPEADKELIERHLEPSPFIIPPVLDKTALASQPVLQAVWSLAKEALLSAWNVYFVGYSLPVTDLAAGFLFRETIGDRSNIVKVVSLANTEEEKENVRVSYRKIFRCIEDSQFEFGGALEWVREITSKT